MWKRSPGLYDKLIPSGRNPVWQLTSLELASFFKPISSEKKGKSGIRPFCALIDEVHEHKDDSVIEMLRAGTKGNREALIFEITNSGHDKTSVCWAEHEYSIKVASGEIKNDAWFAYVCALDSNDSPFDDESCWIKANPTLGVTIHKDFLREQVREAKGMPSKEGLVRRLHFCQWTDSLDGWITKDLWEAVENQDIQQEDYEGRECYGGIDLSYTSDLTAVAWVYPAEDGTFDAFVDFFKPKINLQQAVIRDHARYDLWAEQGYLRLTEGLVIKLAPIAQRMSEVADRSSLKGIAYDRYRHRELADELHDLGIDLPLIEHPQGFRRINSALKDDAGYHEIDEKGNDIQNPLWMPSSVQFLENLIVEKKIRICYNPLLRANAASVVVRLDPAGTDNRIFDKRRSTTRIDGIVALAMAAGLAKTSIKMSTSGIGKRMPMTKKSSARL
jgi:phage terminase large subunit-like protein